MLAEPCDACPTGIAALWGWDGRRLCWNCVDDLDARFLTRHPGYEDRKPEAVAEAPVEETMVVAKPDPEPPAPTLF